MGPPLADVGERMRDYLAGREPRSRNSRQLEEYLPERREEGSARRTVNADLVAVRSFCRWLMDKGRIRDDPSRLRVVLECGLN